MTHRTLYGRLVLFALLSFGCSKEKPQEAAMRPVHHENASSPTWPSDQNALDGPPAVEAPASDWPTEEDQPPQLDAAPWQTQTVPPFTPQLAPAEAPRDRSHRVMAAPPDQALSSGAGLTPPAGEAANATARENATATSVPRIDARAAAPQEENYQVVDVFYGTDRARITAAAPDLKNAVRYYRGALGVLAATLILAGVFLIASKRRVAAALGIAGILAAAVLGFTATSHVARLRQAAQNDRVQYGDGRGELEMGVCRVSIPKDHRTGEIEAPSVLRLEFREDPQRHVVLLEAKAYASDEFFSRLRQTVAASRRRELLVFIHGYNVAFDNAVRRTAQIAYDLKFPGAAVCYSWPSHGGLLLYPADENNVEWTVPHLKQFLTRLRRESGAEAINLIGHSMGTRALTDALRDFARETEQQGAAFHQVVLAAPDIDAEVFRRDLAPALAHVSQRVTLYASSNDQALLASRKLHAYPRAGESGANLVVTPGIDTIDVSAIDTSLLGHSYYGDNDSIIADLYRLVHDALPPSRRERLQAAARNGLPYWVFSPGPRIALPDGASSPPR